MMDSDWKWHRAGDECVKTGQHNQSSSCDVCKTNPLHSFLTDDNVSFVSSSAYGVVLGYSGSSVVVRLRDRDACVRVEEVLILKI